MLTVRVAPQRPRSRTTPGHYHASQTSIVYHKIQHYQHPSACCYVATWCLWAPAALTWFQQSPWQHRCIQQSMNEFGHLAYDDFLTICD
jgi:hypothetical protein